jgi:hypothetical protein
MHNYVKTLAMLTSIFAKITAESFTITIPFQDYPTEELKKHPRPINPIQVDKQLMKTYFYQPISYGIYGLYNGYLASTNNIGLLTFPRTTQYEDFTIIITEKINPVFLKENTLSHWFLDNQQQATFFLIKKHKDPETKLVYWKTQSVNIPADNIVPLHAIVILAKPNDIYVPLGITPTNNLPNLVLPQLYAKRQLDHLTQALFILNIKQFFAPVTRLTKLDQLSLSTLITT